MRLDHGIYNTGMRQDFLPFHCLNPYRKYGSNIRTSILRDMVRTAFHRVVSIKILQWTEVDHPSGVRHVNHTVQVVPKLERSQDSCLGHSRYVVCSSPDSYDTESHGTVHAEVPASCFFGKKMKSVRYFIAPLILFCSMSWAGTQPLGGDFTLNTTKNIDVSLSSFKGKVVLLYFGFTHCPDMCPTELLQFKQVLEMLPADKRALVQPIFISVDPKRDTAEVLDPYVGFFDKRILALTGSEEELRKVASQYGAQFRYVPTGSTYTVDHTVNMFLINPQGKLVRIIPYGTPTQNVLQLVTALLP
jgi:protein SCO1/2